LSMTTAGVWLAIVVEEGCAEPDGQRKGDAKEVRRGKEELAAGAAVVAVAAVVVVSLSDGEFGGG
jgi:hypothetical protein